MQEDVFTEAEVAACIAPVSTFDPNYLDFYNFLEGIVRVANARPWTEEEQKEYQHFENKIDRICNLLEEQYYEECNPKFEQIRENFEHERRYQPRIVVPDTEEDGDSDEDELQ